MLLNSNFPTGDLHPISSCLCWAYTKMRCVAIFAFAMMASGCVTVSEIYTENGEIGYNIDCRELTWGDCYNKAGELCGEKGYEILAKDSDQDQVTGINAYGLYSGTTNIQKYGYSV